MFQSTRVNILVSTLIRFKIHSKFSHCFHCLLVLVWCFRIRHPFRICTLEMQHCYISVSNIPVQPLLITKKKPSQSKCFVKDLPSSESVIFWCNLYKSLFLKPQLSRDYVSLLFEQLHISTNWHHYPEHKADNYRFKKHILIFMLYDIFQSVSNIFI